jgi:hypothetical protein
MKESSRGVDTLEILQCTLGQHNNKKKQTDAVDILF